MVDKQDFLEWRDSPVTEELKKNLQEAVEGIASRILTRQESNPMDDQFLKGLMRGLTETLEWVPDLREEQNGTS